MGSARTIIVTALAFGCASPAPSLSHSRQSSTTFSTTFDVVILNGGVVDGSGAPAVRADVGVVGDRVTEVGDLSRAPAVRRIDVHGELVAPGFIDMLGQDEINVLIDNRVESKIRQGITTEITGEGRSAAPLNDALITEEKQSLEPYGLHVDWRDFAGYRRHFEMKKSTINLGTYVGAASVRRVVLGLGDVQPSAAELVEMERLVETAMAEGALGVSSALIYPPGSYAKTGELIALAKVAARSGGIYATHLRNEADNEMASVEEALTIWRRTSRCSIPRV